MGQRLTQIATRTGDDGTSRLGDDTHTRKDALRVAAMGDVDELNSTLGVLLGEPLPNRAARSRQMRCLASRLVCGQTMACP